jgi:hypothetical protein
MSASQALMCPAVGIITLILIWRLQAAAVEIAQQRSKRASKVAAGRTVGGTVK